MHLECTRLYGILEGLSVEDISNIASVLWYSLHAIMIDYRAESIR